MSQDAKETNKSKDAAAAQSGPDGSYTPPAQPAKNAPEGVNPGPPTTAPVPTPPQETAISTPRYVAGGLNPEVLNSTVDNPALSNQNFPFSSGHKMNEVAQYQNLFTFPLDTYYNVFDAINYFSDETNRNRYNYEHQQIIISRIVRAAQEFGIPIEGIRDKLAN